MKKHLLFGLLLLSLSSLRLAAQTAAPEKPIKTGNEWKMPGDVLKRSKAFADTLRQQLGLTAEQTKAVHDAYLANTKPLDEIGVLPISDKEKQNRLRANKAALDETLKGIFTASQLEKYQLLTSIKKH